MAPKVIFSTFLALLSAETKMKVMQFATNIHPNKSRLNVNKQLNLNQTIMIDW